MQKALIFMQLVACRYCSVLSVNTFVSATDKRIHIPKTQKTVEASP